MPDHEQLLFPRRVRLRIRAVKLWMPLAVVLLIAAPVMAQEESSPQRANPYSSSIALPSSSSSSTSPASAAASSPAPDQRPLPKEPALVDPAGPDISLQNSEALFDIAAALNSCGYDAGLAASEPIRATVRQQVDDALRTSAAARNTHDQVCTFIDRHRLSDPGRSLAQYVSLALYTTPPPALAPSAAEPDMPPDATQVMDILPLLRDFSKQIDLHLIWVRNRPQYDRELAGLHDALTKMIVQTNAYLRMPAAAYSGRRFLVVISPLLDPAQTNARVYGVDYVVVASPTNGKIRMQDVRHTYLHYAIEPLLYSRPRTLDRLRPFLKIVEDAPMDYADRSDVVSLVAECMIRAIEARTMDTGVAIFQIPSDTRRSDLEATARQRNATLAKDQTVRRAMVQRSLLQGYVLTPYFYDAFAAFEKQTQSFSQSIGPMVYGMDVQQELSRAKHIDFVAQASPEVVRRTPPATGLDLAEADMAKGEPDAAGALAQKALDDPSQAGRANFILARVAILHGNVTAAQRYFQEAARLSKDPRTVAWSHIYLGRIDDVQNRRELAMTEYRAALTARDGQPDTKRAAEKGLQQAYTVPQTVHSAPENGSSNTPDQPSPPGPPQPQRQ